MHGQLPPKRLRGGAFTHRAETLGFLGVLSVTPPAGAASPRDARPAASGNVRPFRDSGALRWDRRRSARAARTFRPSRGTSRPCSGRATTPPLDLGLPFRGKEPLRCHFPRLREDGAGVVNARSTARWRFRRKGRSLPGRTSRSSRRVAGSLAPAAAAGARGRARSLGEAVKPTRSLFDRHVGRIDTEADLCGFDHCPRDIPSPRDRAYLMTHRG
jgi:hypothetical protein